MENEKRYLPDEIYDYEELKQVFADFHIDPEKTRFFVGQDYLEPKAFVIYKNDFDEFVVYKMKADGSRALRYQGNDERYAVNEFYQKFLDEVSRRPQFARKLLAPEKKRTTRRSSGSRAVRAAEIAVVSSTVLVIMLVFGLVGYNRYQHRYDGYYVTDTGSYYRQGDDFYYYDDGWNYYCPSDDFYGYYDDYDYYDYYQYNDEYEDFRDSDYYYVSDDDDDSGWSSNDSWDSWDSDSSDWDSDW